MIYSTFQKLNIIFHIFRHQIHIFFYYFLKKLTSIIKFLLQVINLKECRRRENKLQKNLKEARFYKINAVRSKFIFK